MSVLKEIGQETVVVSDPGTEFHTQSKFSYERLKGQKYFRLLHLSSELDALGSIHGTLEGFERGGTGCPPYVALSYAWGGTSTFMHMMINGRALNITANLYEALMHIRSILPESTPLWIGAVSINQEDFYERSDQVEQMRSIYSEASDVFIWLGPTCEGSDELLAYIRDHESSCRLRKHDRVDCVVPPTPDLRYVLRNLIRRPYWTRYWIIQEFVIARHARLVCGHQTVRRSDFLSVIAEYSNTSDGHFLKTPLYMGPTDHWAVWCILKLGWWSESSVHLAEALERGRTSEATDSRDKVFAILGLVDDGAGQNIVVDYNLPPCTVFCMAIEAMMEDWQKFEDENAHRSPTDNSMEFFVSNTQECRKAIDNIPQTCRAVAALHGSTSLKGDLQRAVVDSNTICEGLECQSRAAMWLISNWHIWRWPMHKEGEGESLWN